MNEVRVAEDLRLFWSLSFALDAGDWDALGGFCEDYVGYGGEDTDFGQTVVAVRVPALEDSRPTVAGGSGAAPTLTPAQKQLLVDVNVKGVVHTFDAALPYLLRAARSLPSSPGT